MVTPFRYYALAKLHLSFLSCYIETSFNHFFIPNRGIFTIFAVIVLVVIGLIGWCAYRFLKKKKPKGAEDKKGEDDENALVDNEEANIEDVSFQK